MLKFDPMLTFAAVLALACAVYAAMGAGWLGAAVLGLVTAVLALPVIALLHA